MFYDSIKREILSFNKPQSRSYFHPYTRVTKGDYCVTVYQFIQTRNFLIISSGKLRKLLLISSGIQKSKENNSLWPAGYMNNIFQYINSNSKINQI